MSVKVKVINRSSNPIPKYATNGAAGMDLYASLSEQVTIKPGERQLIPTGISIQLPIGYEAQVRPRSGLALKKGVTVVNTPGTIDSDYRGEIGIILINHSNEDFVVGNGDRVAQMVIAQYEVCEWEEADSLDESERGDGGFGHTGVKSC